MTTRSSREERIRLCSLRVRYRQAWRSQADSNTLAALLMAIECVKQSLGRADTIEKPLMSDARSSNEGVENAQRSSKTHP